MSLETLFQPMCFLTAAALVVVGLYAVIFMDNLLKKIIGVTLISDGVNLVLITGGFNKIVAIISPEMYEQGVKSTAFETLTEFPEFAAQAAFPLPSALVLTSIVISVSIFAIMLALAIRLYQHYNSMSCSVIFKEVDE
ncbi:MAG: cation:proton antiporter subunit C [Theionarchaea archaeon]|nr:cation:proton antiporter subunit C [Theionarchaea archaeon]